MRSKPWMALAAFVLLALSCNLPAGNVTATVESPQSGDVDSIGTAVEKTSVVRMTEAAGSAVPSSDNAPDEPLTSTPTATPTPTLSPTPCVPLVTATANANVREGPDTAYDIVGFLELGKTAEVAGRNDANTWWYIKYASASGGHAWIAGSVVTTSCLPASVQVVAAPPLPPTPTPTYTEVPATYPDLYVSEYTWSPSPPHKGVSFHVRVGAYNAGNAPAGPFTVEWWLSTSAPAPACTWDIPSMAAKGGRILECDYTPAGWANYPSQVVVDAGDTLEESDEGNNVWAETLQIVP